MREFKKGEQCLSLSDKQFLEVEAMTAENATQNVFQRIAMAGDRNYGRNMSQRMLGSVGSAGPYPDDDLSMEIGSTSQQLKHVTVPLQVEVPHSQVVANAKPFIEGLGKIQGKASYKQTKFIQENLTNTVSPDKVLKQKRGSVQPATSRNSNNNTMIVIPEDIMGNSIASARRKNSTVNKHATPSGTFTQYNTNKPIKSSRFPNMNSPTMQTATRNQNIRSNRVPDDGYH